MKLKIDMRQPEAATLATQYTYRWDRILYAGLATALVLVLIATLAYQLIAGPGETRPAGTPAAAPPSIEPVAAAPSPVLSTAPARPAATVEPAPAAMAIGGGDAPVSSAAIAQTGSASAEASPAYQTAQAASAEAAGSDTTAGHATADGAGQALFSGEKTRIYSAAIRTFQLASAVSDRTPSGTLTDIRQDDTGIATVYAFSEVAGLRGKTLHYYWFLNGKRLATVRIPVTSSPMPGYSSKYINAQMRGDWRVELRTREGELLATSTFQY